MVAAGTAADVHLLPKFHVAIRPENRQPAIAEGVERAGREPVNADVPGPTVSAQHDVAKIFESGILRMMDVSRL